MLRLMLVSVDFQENHNFKRFNFTSPSLKTYIYIVFFINFTFVLILGRQGGHLLSLQVVPLPAVSIFTQLLRMILLEDAVNKVEACETPEASCDAVTAPRRNQ